MSPPAPTFMSCVLCSQERAAREDAERKAAAYDADAAAERRLRRGIEAKRAAEVSEQMQQAATNAGEKVSTFSMHCEARQPKH